MRLNEIRKIINENKKMLNTSVEAVKNDGNIKLVNNVGNVLIALQNLREVSCLTDIIEKLESIPEISSIYTNNAVTVSAGNANNFNSILATLRIKCDTISDLADSILVPLDKNTICVKLPQETDLKTLSDISGDFSSFFDVLLTGANIEGRANFAGVESGSDWIYIALTGAPAFIVLGNKIIDLFYKVYSTYIDAKNLKLKLDIEMELAEVIKKSCQKEIEHLNVEENLNLDHESINKLVRNVAAFTKLLEKGMEIRPSITAPDETQNITSNIISQLQQRLEDMKLLEAPNDSASDNAIPDTTESAPSGEENDPQ